MPPPPSYGSSPAPAIAPACPVRACRMHSSMSARDVCAAASGHKQRPSPPPRTEVVGVDPSSSSSSSSSSPAYSSSSSSLPSPSLLSVPKVVSRGVAGSAAAASAGVASGVPPSARGAYELRQPLLVRRMTAFMQLFTDTGGHDVNLKPIN